MRVQDTLEYLSETTRQAIFGEHSRRFELAAEQDLSLRLQDPYFLSRVWEQASELEQKVIRLFITSSTRGFFSKRSWERVTSHEHRHLSVGLTKLRRLGLILTVRKMWSEIGYMMPQEVREQFTKYLIPEPSTAFVSLSKTLPYYIAGGRGIHLDLFGLLLFIRDNPVPLTQKGSIHRRMQQKMGLLLSIKDEHVRGLVLPPLDKEEREGLALTVVLDIALRLGLVSAHDRKLMHEPHCVREWFVQSPQARWEQMHALVISQYLPHGGWWDALAQLMYEVPVDQWCSLDEQLRILEETGFSLPLEAAGLIKEQWLHLLNGLGWIQLGVDENEQLFWRWSSLPRLPQQEGWFIDASGVITIPPLVPLAAVWEISKFCPLQFDGQLIRGELQAKLFQAFLASGGTEEKALDILRSVCVHPLPESLVELIGQWGKTARQIQIEPYLRVRTAHPGLLEEWKHIADFQPFLTQVISPTDFLITLAQQTELVALLRQFGYEPQVLSPSSATQDERDKADGRQEAGLFFVERPWDGYAVENTFPDQWDGLPQVSSLPKMWTQHFQSYHPQSLRDLLKRASELELEVEIQRTDQTRWQGIPVDVRVEMGYWMATLEAKGTKNRYRLDEIDRVRIVVPDYLY